MTNRFSSFLRKCDFEGALGHWMVMCICLGALAVAAVLDLPSEKTPSVSAAGLPIPSLCGFKNMTGQDCPGCGLTRSWVAGADGQWRVSFQYHRMGLLIMFYTLLQAVRHGMWLALAGQRTRVDAWGARLDRLLILLAILLVINWVVGFFL